MKIRLFTIPNLLTLSNLLCGVVATVVALTRGDLALAFWLMVLAAAFDFLDGFVARLLGQSGPLGMQLDSLADDVTFGVLPAAVLYVLYGRASGGALPDWAAWSVFVLPLCAALRLAKFNIDDTQRTEFCGLPSPAAALFCASLGYVATRCGWALPREAIVGAAFVMGALMIAPVRMFALKFHGFGWRGNELRWSFVGVALAGLCLFGVRAVPAVILLYIVASTVRWLLLRGAAPLVPQDRRGD